MCLQESPTRLDTNWLAQLQWLARILKFQIYMIKHEILDPMKLSPTCQPTKQIFFFLMGLFYGLTLVHRQKAKLSTRSDLVANIWHQRYKLIYSNIKPNINKIIRSNILKILILAEAIRTTVVPIRILIRTTIMPIRILIRMTEMWLMLCVA